MESNGNKEWVKVAQHNEDYVKKSFNLLKKTQKGKKENIV